MMKKFTAFVLSGAMMSEMAFAQAVTPTSVIICREKQCATASQTMTREYLYNQLLLFFENNSSQNVLFCEADQIHRVCYENGIRFKTQVGLSPAYATIESAKILQVKTVPNSPAVDISFDYNLSLNETHPTCQAAVTRMQVSSADSVRLESSSFDCEFATLGRTAMNTSFTIDYVDFDYGLVGAHYVIGTSRVAKGGGSGYMLMRFSTLTDTDNTFDSKDQAELERLKVEKQDLQDKVETLQKTLDDQQRAMDRAHEEDFGEPVYDTDEEPVSSTEMVPSGTVQIFPVNSR